MLRYRMRALKTLVLNASFVFDLLGTLMSGGFYFVTAPLNFDSIIDGGVTLLLVLITIIGQAPDPAFES